jgi:hypothetical protein
MPVTARIARRPRHDRWQMLAEFGGQFVAGQPGPRRQPLYRLPAQGGVQLRRHDPHQRPGTTPGPHGPAESGLLQAFQHVGKSVPRSVPGTDEILHGTRTLLPGALTLGGQPSLQRLDEFHVFPLPCTAVGDAPTIAKTPDIIRSSSVRS